jgi:hypothetical protein
LTHNSSYRRGDCLTISVTEAEGRAAVLLENTQFLCRFFWCRGVRTGHQGAPPPSNFYRLLPDSCQPLPDRCRNAVQLRPFFRYLRLIFGGTRGRVRERFPSPKQRTRPSWDGSYSLPRLSKKPLTQRLSSGGSHTSPTSNSLSQLQLIVNTRTVNTGSRHKYQKMPATPHPFDRSELGSGLRGRGDNHRWSPEEGITTTSGSRGPVDNHERTSSP